MNFIKIINVLCHTLMDQTILKSPDGKGSVKQYLLLRKSLDAAPLSTVTISTSTASTIRREYLLTGL